MTAGKAPDPGAVRSRRSLAHRAGDHSLCDASRCRHVRVARDAAEPLVLPAESVADAVQEFIAACHFRPDDARSPLAAMVVRLGRLADADPANVAAGRELVHVLSWLAEHPGTPADGVDEIQARRLAAVPRRGWGSSSERLGPTSVYAGVLIASRRAPDLFL